MSFARMRLNLTQLSLSRESKMSDPQFYIHIRGVRPSDQQNYGITLGPWTTIEKAVEHSDTLTDTRIGEQLLQKLGVTELRAFEES